MSNQAPPVSRAGPSGPSSPLSSTFMGSDNGSDIMSGVVTGVTENVIVRNGVPPSGGCNDSNNRTGLFMEDESNMAHGEVYGEVYADTHGDTHNPNPLDDDPNPSDDDTRTHTSDVGTNVANDTAPDNTITQSPLHDNPYHTLLDNFDDDIDEDDEDDYDDTTVRAMVSATTNTTSHNCLRAH